MDTGLDDGTGAWQPMRRLNLNQLYTLDAVLKARTLTEAGRLVSLGQPAMSMALRKLRERFGDELVVYGGGDRQLTELGRALRARVGYALRVADDTFNLSVDFVPATANRSIFIAAPETIELLFLTRVVRTILSEAPGVNVQMMPFDYRSVGGMFDRGVDVVVVPADMADPRFESMPLFDISISGLVWANNVHAEGRMSVDQYLAADHVALFPAIERQVLFGTGADPLLSRRRVVARTALYSMLPSLVIGTMLVATLDGWLAQYYSSMLPVRLVDLPLQTPPASLVVQWQTHRDREPMILWIIDHLLRAIV